MQRSARVRFGSSACIADGRAESVLLRKRKSIETGEMSGKCQKRKLAPDDIAEKAMEVIVADAREIDRKREMIAERNNGI